MNSVQSLLGEGSEFHPPYLPTQKVKAADSIQKLPPEFALSIQRIAGGMIIEALDCIRRVSPETIKRATQGHSKARSTLLEAERAAGWLLNPAGPRKVCGAIPCRGDCTQYTKGGLCPRWTLEDCVQVFSDEITVEAIQEQALRNLRDQGLIIE